MSTTLYIKPKKSAGNILPLVKSAIDAEIVKLELALKMADKRLQPSETKYNVTSHYFLENMTAEDLDGNDGEYVAWAGEYKLKLELTEKLRQLREIDYDRPEVF